MDGIPAIGEAGGIFGIALLLAFCVEAVLEYVLGVWWKPLAEATRQKVLMGAGLVVGIGLALVYRVDLLAAMGLAPSLAGQLVSGALIGRGADYLHGFLKRVKG